MSTAVNITEYQNIVHLLQGTTPIANEDSTVIDQAPITIGAGSVQSAAFNSNTKFVRIHSGAPCSINFGTSPTATASNRRMGTEATEYFGVIGGQKVAVITSP